MMTRPKTGWTLFATALLALLLAFPALAAHGNKAPNPNNGHGKITALSATSITVTPKKTGISKTYSISSSTKVTVDGAASTVSALATGQRAHIKSKDGTTARMIKVSTKKHGKRAKL
ncbi:MAG: hypothetical protein M3Y13_07790 [Armatimonadota bacterium]|nr:hypothetical protein [Armatimonadota bacterium]